MAYRSVSKVVQSSLVSVVGRILQFAELSSTDRLEVLVSHRFLSSQTFLKDRSALMTVFDSTCIPDDHSAAACRESRLHHC